LDLNLQWFRPF